MSGLWQISFRLPDQIDAVAEMVGAAAAVEAVSFHRAHDEDPWLVQMICTEEPRRDKIEMAIDTAYSVTGQNVSDLTIIRLPETDWLSENRKSFPPLDIGSFWIHGSHITTPVPEGKTGLCIDAGQAFGSGTHGTTEGCITMLEKHLPGDRSLRIADIGCGSGILAMAAAKLCPSAHIIAVDNDPVAVDVTARNTRDNSVDGIITTGVSDGYESDLVRRHAPYDMILSNILPGPLVAMAGDAAKALSSGGVLILSGVLENQAEQVVNAHARHGLSLKDQMIVSGWATIVMEGA
jgi:ribosomal protein L11 methyltransferase